MLEIREIEVNGYRLKVQEMNWETAEKYVEGGKALANNSDATIKDWNERTISVVLENLKAAGNEEWTAERFKKEFGMKGTRKILESILDASGLLPVEPGGAKAA